MKFSLRGLCSLIFALTLTAVCVPDVMEPGDGDASQYGVASYTAYADGMDTKAVLAVYPYASGAYSGNFDDMYVSNVTIPSEQTAVAGSYNPNAVWKGSSHTTTMNEGQFYLLVSDPGMCL